MKDLKNIKKVMKIRSQEKTEEILYVKLNHFE